jgi:hypothetical protein
MTAPRSSGGHEESSVTMSTEERLAELEHRLTHVEAGPRLRERGRSMLERVVPREAGQHFRNGARENLTGMRTVIDHWIRRLDESDEGATRSHERETIEIR